jgi:hypothetical protein
MRSSALSLFAIACLAASTPLSAQRATTICKDGTRSEANGRGNCGGHGGVDSKATKQEAAATTTRARTGRATVTCSDGSMSNAGRGACSRNGGVQVVARSIHEPTSTSSTSRRSTSTTRPDRGSQRNVSQRGGIHDPTGALARCTDGTYSHATSRRGACASHKGVAQWM